MSLLFTCLEHEEYSLVDRRRPLPGKGIKHLLKTFFLKVLHPTNIIFLKVLHVPNDDFLFVYKGHYQNSK